MTHLLDCFLALFLLTAPVPDATAAWALEQMPQLQSSVLAAAVELELADPRETTWIFQPWEPYETDATEYRRGLDLLRGRHRELAGAPPLRDCLRFPPHASIEPQISFNRAHRDWLVGQREVEPYTTDQQLWQDWIDETDEIHAVLIRARNAQCDYWHVPQRREELGQLRELLGLDAFYSGRLPPAAPFGRFTEVR